MGWEDSLTDFSLLSDAVQSEMKAKDIIIEELEKELPKADSPFTVFYWRSKDAQCRPLVYRGGYKETPDNKTDPSSTDTLTTHFVVLAFGGVIIYAIEIMIYKTPDGQQTIFISKADTTGHYTLNASMEIIKRPKLSYAKVTTGILRGLLRCFIDPEHPVKICLFARSEKQYLFPLSSECPSKHILTGSQLLRWWIKVLMDTLKHDELISSVERARLQIPGNDSTRIKSFFPRSQSPDSPSVNWEVGDVFWPDDELVLPAVKCIPRFPDDPLTRFLDFLVTDKRALSTSQERFWVELQAQQEFRLSIEVGILGVDFHVNPSRSVYRDLQDNKDNSVAALRTRDFNTLREFISTLDYSIYDINEEALETLIRRNPKIDIFGKVEEEVTAAANDSSVNVLNVGLIKRKAPKPTTTEPAVNVLGAGLIKRKKPASEPEPVVNELDTSIIRKKQKK